MPCVKLTVNDTFLYASKILSPCLFLVLTLVNKSIDSSSGSCTIANSSN